MNKKNVDENKVSSKDAFDDEIPKIGNTLDFYNETMSKKAVGSLFDGDFDNLKVGKNEENENNSKSMPSNLGKNEADMEKNRVTIEKDSEEYPFDSDDIVVFNKADANEERKNSQVSASDRKKRRQAAADFFDEDSNSEKSEAKKKAVKNQPKELNDDDEEVSPKKTRKKSSKSFLEEIDEDVTVKRPERTRKAVSEDTEEDDDDEYYDDEPHRESKGILMFSISGFTILLLILAYLVFQVRILNNEVESNLSQLAEYTQIKQDYETLKIENDGLSTDYNKLSIELESLKNNGYVDNSSASTDGNNETSAESSDDPADNATIYTVQNGDTLSIISQKVYGTSKEYEKIKVANGLTSDNISPGQKLVIPQ